MTSFVACAATQSLVWRFLQEVWFIPVSVHCLQSLLMILTMKLWQKLRQPYSRKRNAQRYKRRNYLPASVMCPLLIFVRWEIKWGHHKVESLTLLSVPQPGLCKTVRSRNSTLLLLSCVSDIYHYAVASAISRGGEEPILFFTSRVGFIPIFFNHLFAFIYLVQPGGKFICIVIIIQT